MDRVGNFRQKNNSAEDGIDGTNGYFRRNSGYSAEQKTSEFRSEPFHGRENNSEFRSVAQKQKQTLGFPSEPFSSGTKIEANSRNPLGIPFRTLLRKGKQLGIPFRGRKIRSKLSEFRSELFLGRENYSEQNAVAPPPPKFFF